MMNFLNTLVLTVALLTMKMSNAAAGQFQNLEFRGEMRFRRGGFDNDGGCDRRTTTQVCLLDDHYNNAVAETTEILHGNSVTKLGWRLSYEDLSVMTQCFTFGVPAACLQAKQTKNDAVTWTVPVELSIYTVKDYATLHINWEYGCRGWNFWYGSCASMSNQNTDHISQVTIDECYVDGNEGMPKIAEIIHSDGLLQSSQDPVKWSVGTNNNVEDPYENFWAKLECV